MKATPHPHPAPEATRMVPENALILSIMTALFLVLGYLGVPVAFSLMPTRARGEGASWPLRIPHLTSRLFNSDSSSNRRVSLPMCNFHFRLARVTRPKCATLIWKNGRPTGSTFAVFCWPITSHGRRTFVSSALTHKRACGPYAGARALHAV